jgi:hypothetical protein
MGKIQIQQLADKEWLQTQYVDLERSGPDIAEELGCTAGAVEYRLHQFGIPRRSTNNAANLKRLRPKTCERCGRSYQAAGPAQRLCDECWRIRTCECGTEFVLPPTAARTKDRAGRKLCDACRALIRRLPKRQESERRRGDTFTCRDCHRQFPVSESVKDSSRARGIMERCKECDKDRKKSYRDSPETGPAQRVKVRDANRALRRDRKAAGMSWHDSLTDEQLEGARAKQRKRAREARWTAIGATSEWYAAQFEKQGGKCAICGTSEPWRGLKGMSAADEYFCIDHDHETGELRELLCKGCNTGIGALQEDVVVLEAAVAYLRKWKP